MNVRSLVIILALSTALAAQAQTLHVTCNNVVHSFSADRTGVMNFDRGTTLTIQGREFNLSDISGMTVDDQAMPDNTVTVRYNGGTAQVAVAGNISRYLSVAVSGADVTVTQGDEVGDDTCGEISYILSGESADGSFVLVGDYKASIELQGLSLSSATGAAVDIQNGKRIAVRVKEGTVNNLSDAAAGSQKAALYCKGHLEFKQKGTLNVTGNKSHAIAAKEYVQIKNTAINVLGAKKDGINCNQYLLMESGKVTISNTGDDGIQVSYKDDADRDAEDTGTVTINGGTLDITATAPAAKAIKAAGDFIANGGTVTATVSGSGTWDSVEKKTKAAACISAGGNCTVSAGTFTLTATAGGGKGISVDGNLNISGGTFDIVTTGGRLAYVNGSLNQNYTGNADNLNSDYKSSPKGIKVDGDIVIGGGALTIETKGAGGEGIESKKTLTVDGGAIVIRAYEDGINATSHIYINGGDITVTTGTGDAIDSNANIYVAGGRMTVIGAKSPEQGFDAGDGYSIYITGGEILAAAGGNSTPSKSTSTQAYVILSQSVTAGTEVSVSDGATTLVSFTIPQAYGTASPANSASRAPGGWDWGWGGGNGGNGGSLLISCPDMVSGKSYTVKVGTTSTNSTARLTGGSSGR